MTTTNKKYAALVSTMTVEDLRKIRPQVEARMNQFKILENTVAMNCERIMLDTVDRRIAALNGEMFYIVIDDIHRIELTPKGNYYPQYLVHDGAGDHFAYYHLALTRWNESTHIARVECNINQMHYRTEAGAMAYLLKKIVMEETPISA